jgi:exodeoxyribonuclease-5
LKQLHPQAAGNPIIRQAHRALAGTDYAPDGDAFQVVRKGGHELLRQAQVLLVHYYGTRRWLNQLTRRVVMCGAVPGRPAADGSFDPASEYPRAGERVLVCWDAPRHNVWNGDIEVLAADVRLGDRSVRFVRASESSAGVEFPLLRFSGMPGTGGVPGGLELDFGYALTVHKAQGSEWPFVVILDEFPRNDPKRPQWIYTALTRASQRVVVVNRYR